MANGTWKRSTAASRRAERQVKYLFVARRVGVKKNALGMSVPVVEPVGRTYRKPK